MTANTSSQRPPTASEIAKSPAFLAACERLEVKLSVRQARDFRRKIGRFGGGTPSPTLPADPKRGRRRRGKAK